MTKPRATEENYRDILDSMNCMQTLELVAEIISYFEDDHENFDTYILEKPHKYPEVYVPALNGELEGRVTEWLTGAMEVA